MNELVLGLSGAVVGVAVFILGWVMGERRPPGPPPAVAGGGVASPRAGAASAVPAVAEEDVEAWTREMMAFLRYEGEDGEGS